jgi:hypothetical protein
LHALLETVNMDSLGLLSVLMGLIPIVIEGIYGREWLTCLVGGACCGALGETSTTLDFLVKDRATLIFVPLWWSPLIFLFFFIFRASWIFPL